MRFTTERNSLVKGFAGQPGRVGGSHVILDPALIDTFKEGEILTTMTAPDWVPAMKKAKAIVTDAGGMTCHASIVNRELGIPCIVGTKSRGAEATTTIPDGATITVDATNGIVYEGLIEDLVKKAERPAATAAAANTYPQTGTKVYMNLGDPDLAEKYSLLPCDGIGLMLKEFIWTTFIHEHPLYLIEIGKPERWSTADGIRKGLPGDGTAPRYVALQRFQIERIPRSEGRRQVRTV